MVTSSGLSVSLRSSTAAMSIVNGPVSVYMLSKSGMRMVGPSEDGIEAL
jgi:hypothetical protein